MVLLKIIERRAYAAFLLGVPLLISLGISSVYDHFMSSVPLESEELLEKELLEMERGQFKSSDLKMPVLLWWTPFSVSQTRLKECKSIVGPSCIVSKDRRLLHHPNTKAVFFYGTHFKAEDLPARRPEQDWALLHEESPKNNFVVGQEATLKHFNHTATFRRHSDLPLTLQYLEGMEALKQDRFSHSVSRKNQLMEEEDLAPIVYVHSSCENPMMRDEFVAELGRHIRIDSYGSCLNNRTLPEAAQRSQGRGSRKALFQLVSKYKFALTIENAECEDYVTEKLWNSLTVGTVPIYLGAPNVEDYMPNKNSAILVKDFDTIKALGDFIMSMTDEEYERRLLHKKGVISNQHLADRMNARWWGVSESQQIKKGNFIEAFECLVCKRVTEDMRMAKSGFARSLPREASADHYGCGYPKGAFGAMKGERWRVPKGNVWQELYIQSLVKSFVLDLALESKKLRLPREEDFFMFIMGDSRVLAFKKKCIEKMGDVSKQDLEDLKSVVRRLLRDLVDH